MVNDWVNKNYENIKDWLKGAIKYEDESVREDLFHEVLMIFIQHPKAEQLIENDQARWFLVRIALNQSRSTSSDHYKLYKKNHSFEFIEDRGDFQDTEYDHERDSLIEDVLEVLDDMYRGTNRERYYVMLILLYFTVENFAELSRRLKIPRSTIKKNFKEGLEYIRIKMFTVDRDEIKLDNTTIKILKTKLLENYGKELS
jgi:DNA-directed RNA polymerase specialized sigma24 family protein